jgi:aminodeoxyfutalosine synthase
VISPVSEFERAVEAGRALTRTEAEALLATPDLIGVGMLGETARKAIAGDRVTYGRVCEWPLAAPEGAIGRAGEVRIVATPATVDDARALVREAAAATNSAALTGFSLAQLAALAGGDHLALAELAGALAADGLWAVAEAPLDELGDVENAAELVRAARHGGLQVPRATITKGDLNQRLDLIESAVTIQRETSAFQAFAPLPRRDAVEAPSTGYDDVRTVAIARLMCRAIAFLQVDWPLYGPKLAQVAIAYGANDIDGVAATEASGLGPRRAPREDIERQIRSAGAAPAERNGRYEIL